MSLQILEYNVESVLPEFYQYLVIYTFSAFL
jgi:hypothetical protein